MVSISKYKKHHQNANKENVNHHKPQITQNCIIRFLSKNKSFFVKFQLKN
jgi:hypothetical protein